uniref:Putative secreted peptide n=1 Tax=Anopheles braziliensis TaxID=58242 RepID=A0A2M3ZSX6_9DIPT
MVGVLTITAITIAAAVLLQPQQLRGLASGRWIVGVVRRHERCLDEHVYVPVQQLLHDPADLARFVFVVGEQHQR